MDSSTPNSSLDSFGEIDYPSDPTSESTTSESTTSESTTSDNSNDEDYHSDSLTYVTERDTSTDSSDIESTNSDYSDTEYYPNERLFNIESLISDDEDHHNESPTDGDASSDNIDDEDWESTTSVTNGTMASSIADTIIRSVLPSYRRRARDILCKPLNATLGLEERSTVILRMLTKWAKLCWQFKQNKSAVLKRLRKCTSKARRKSRLGVLRLNSYLSYQKWCRDNFCA